MGPSSQTSPAEHHPTNNTPSSSSSAPQSSIPARAATHGSSIVFSSDSMRSPGTARRQDATMLSNTSSPPPLERLESVPLMTAHNRLPFVPARRPSPPPAPARREDEGVTSATVHSSQRQHRRSSSQFSPGRGRSGMSNSSFDYDSPSRAHSLKHAFSRNRASETGTESRRTHRSRSRNRSRSRQRDLLQEAADSLDPPAAPREHGEAGGDESVIADDSQLPSNSKPKKLARKLKPTRLVDLHRLRPDIAHKSILPTVAFPGQGSGRDSEFLQEAPIWSRYPWKAIYLVYFGLSVGLVFLPWFALVSILKSTRPRASWTWKRATLVRLYRHGTKLTFRTHTNLSRDISQPVPHSETLRCKFIWIDSTPDEDIRGELKRAMEVQRIHSTRTCGFWYGEPLDSDLCDAAQSGEGAGSVGVGRRAGVDEKVVYHLHGGAYWIGTAHEKDVTAAVNTEVLRYLSELYKGDRSASSGANRCTRSLSLDYRLSVPNRPRIGSYPAALLDALAGYLYLIRYCGFKAQNIIVAGDSAGGNLALALCRYLRDEKIEAMPGSLLLLSPWADVSRSHSGPLSAPNLFSSASRNKGADIISKSVAFRNTAVSAFIGDLAAKETYRNPYLSSCSLQLDPSEGGDGPDWGFEGFPLKTYIVTGSAEISNDQHLTLAHRMASGSKRRTPIYTGDAISQHEDPYEMAARLNYPRPSDHEISLWPSATVTPAGIGGGISTGRKKPAGSPSLSHSVSSSEQKNSVATAADADANMFEMAGALEQGDSPNVPITGSKNAHGSIAAAQDDNNAKPQPTENGPPNDEISRQTAGRGKKEPGAVKTADFEHADDKQDTKPQLSRAGLPHARQSELAQDNKDKMHINLPENSQVRPAAGPHKASSAMQPRRPQLAPLSSSAAFFRAQSRSDARPDAIGAQPPSTFPLLSESPPGHESDEEHESGSEGYFDLGGEDRRVWLDEVKDGVHDLLLFPWHEPERGQCWKRIAQWIDQA